MAAERHGCYAWAMLMLANVAALLLLSLLPGGEPRSDPHGLRGLVEDPATARLLLEGHLGEYGAALDGALSSRLAEELSSGKRRVSAASVRELVAERAELGGLWRAIKTAISVATLATRLQALGPAAAVKEALGWVETGLVRRSGIRPADFGAFFRIAKDPARASLGEGERDLLARNLTEATGAMDSGFGRVLGKLTELLP